MIRARQLLGDFPLVRTSSIEELERSLGRIIAKPVIELVGRDNNLDAVLNYFKLQNIGISYGSYGTNARFRFSESKIVGHVFPLGGAAEVKIVGRSIISDFNHSLIVPADDGFTMTNSADYERLSLSINPGALNNLLSAMTGETVDSTLRIDPAPNSTPLLLSLREHVLFLVRQLCTTAVSPPLLLEEFEQAIMVMFLHVNRHNYSHLLEREPAHAAPLQVRHAEEYIEANWNKPMSFEALAAGIGVSLRSLFATYRHSRGYSPVEFLRRTRLRHAQRILQHPDAATTVEGVAFACGFGNQSRFERDYLRAFGERPSQTLSHNKHNIIIHH